MKKAKKLLSKVLIATPTMDGKLEAYYVDSLLNTLVLGAAKGYDIKHLFVGYDSLLPRARNDLVKAAIDNDFDELLFIDADMVWNPEWVIQLLETGLDYVGGTARKKNDDTYDFAMKITPDLLNQKFLKDQKDILEVQVVGTGFLKLSKNVLKKIGEISQDYTNGPEKARANKMYFETSINDKGELIGEDATLCDKWREVGGTCYLHTKMTCGHIGPKMFTGDFKTFHKEFVNNHKKQLQNKKIEEVKTDGLAQ
tara:strand:- start:16180 stop:16941 length:762 start_codon:yes stop_codon:yes gene_type:complete